MRKTFQYKLYNAKQNKHLRKQINISGLIYNHCIALHKRYYRLFGKSLNKYSLQKHITKLKKQSKYSYWNHVGSQAIQDITDRIEKGYNLFFDSLKKNKADKVAPPNFKKVKKYKSFTLKQAGWKIVSNNRIKIGKKVYKFHKSREINGIIKTVTIKRDSLNDLYLYFSCVLSDETKDSVMTGKMAGFDFGLKTFLTSSDNEQEIDSPLFFRKGLNKIKKANKELSRKKKGSNHRKQARLNLARVHKKVTNQRKDYQFKLAKELAEQYDYMFFEDLNIKAMQKLWGKKVNDLAFHNFLLILQHYCKQHGKTKHHIDRFFPSSKTCHVCGYINNELSLKDRSWHCPDCGGNLDRDYNAALNILREGASSLGLGDVRPLLQAIPV